MTFTTFKNEATLLIIDRKEDPLSPLLNQWTYQAMIHELIGINLDRINPSKLEKIKTDEILLNPNSDIFYRENLYSNYGEVAMNVKNLIDNFQTK